MADRIGPVTVNATRSDGFGDSTGLTELHIGVKQLWDASGARKPSPDTARVIATRGVVPLPPMPVFVPGAGFAYSSPVRSSSTPPPAPPPTTSFLDLLMAGVDDDAAPAAAPSDEEAADADLEEWARGVMNYASEGLVPAAASLPAYDAFSGEALAMHTEEVLYPDEEEQEQEEPPPKKAKKALPLVDGCKCACGVCPATTTPARRRDKTSRQEICNACYMVQGKSFKYLHITKGVGEGYAHTFKPCWVNQHEDVRTGRVVWMNPPVNDDE